MEPKPSSCAGCPLETNGRGFAHPEGPIEADICLVGEALGSQEAREGKPFVGQAGAILNRVLGMMDHDRARYRIGNIISCQPPNDWLVNSPWEHGAINHCARHRIKLSGHKVYVTLGVTATRVLVDQRGTPYAGKIEDWQSYVVGDGPYVIPTFHPAYIMRGNQKLTGAFIHALLKANEIAQRGFTRSEVDLVVDPDPQWFDAWAATVFDTENCWLAVDIETPGKALDESEVVEALWTGCSITRINFATGPRQGITVPWDPRYLTTIKRLLLTPFPKIFWNERFDVPILTEAGCAIGGPIMDGMWAWHILQSALPRGLGFVAPFYSDLPPWKHLGVVDPGPYAALDAVQTFRCMEGIAHDLQAAQQWDTFINHVVKFDAQVLHPAEQIGLRLDPDRLRQFHSELQKRQDELFDEIQNAVPPDFKPLVGGWKRPPSPDKHPNAIAMTVTETVKVCTDCGEIDVNTRHRCKKDRRK